VAADDTRAQAVLHELRRRDAWVSFADFGWDIREPGHTYPIPETAVRERLSQLVDVGLVETGTRRRPTGNGLRNVQVWRALPKGEAPAA
jgi:hypothetical protein